LNALILLTIQTKRMDNIENNKLIAEFMGNIIRDNIVYFPMLQECTIDELEYHTSWDWLMPVVEKIEYMEEGVANGNFLLECIGNSAKFILDDGTRLFKDNMYDTKLEATYQAVVEFINFYNKNNK